MKRATAIFVVCALLGVTLPSDTQAAGQQSFVSAPWIEIESPMPEDKVPGTPDGRHLRIRLDVAVPAGTEVDDLPVQASIDLAAVLRDPSMAGYPAEPGSGRLLGFELDVHSFSLVEVDAEDRPLAASGKGRLPLQVFPGSFEAPVQFDARSNPVVTLRWVMPGTTMGERHFHVYFDSVQNGPREPFVPASHDLGRIAAAAGPGRGTDLYVPLPGISSNSADTRSIHLTNLRPSATQVEVYAYDSLTNKPGQSPLATLTLPAGEGERSIFTYPANLKSSGLLYIKAEAPIFAEAMHGRLSSGFQAGATTSFLPASDGGFVGSAFRQQPTKDSTWYVYCHGATLGGASQCEGVMRADGAPSAFSVDPGEFATGQVSAGQRIAIDMSAGRVAVQRVGTSSLDRGPSYWPALDGPAVASMFVGHALAGVRAETLLMHAPGGGASLTVRDLAGDRATLAHPDLPWDLARGVTNDEGIGVMWSKQWPTSQGGTSRHQDGPVLLEPAFQGDPATRGLHAVSGFIDGADTAAFSALVPLQSADGGLHYSFSIPQGPDGQPLGRLVLFAPHPTTAVTVQSGDGGSRSLNLQQHQYVDTWQEMQPSPGYWSVVADRPVFVAWLKAGTEPMSGFAMGVTNVAQVTATASQVSGPLIAMAVEPSLRTAKAGETVSFAVTVTNHGRSTEGTAMADGVELSVEPPAGWTDVTVSPKTLLLEPDGTGQATVHAKVPLSGGGAVLRLVAASLGSQNRGGNLEVTENLVVNVLQKHAVQVVADGTFTSSLTKSVDAESPTAAYRVTVRNTGSTVDSFNVQYPTATEQWSVEVHPLEEAAPRDPRCQGAVPALARTPELGPGELATYDIDVTLDAAIDDPFRFLGFFTAVSVQDCSAVDNVKLIAQKAGQFAFSTEVHQPARVVKPGDSTTFLVNITNEAEQLELNATIVANAPVGWADPQIFQFLDGPDEPPTLLPRNRSLVKLDPLAVTQLAVRQEIPADAAPLASGVNRLLLQSTDRSRQPSDETILRVTAAEVVGFEAALDPPQLAAVPGGSAEVTLVLTSTGNVPQTVRIDAAALGNHPWMVREPDAQPWLVELAPGVQERLELAFDVPESAAPSSTPDPRVVVAMAADGLPYSEIPIKASVEERRRAEPLREGIAAEPGRTTSTKLPIKNTGNVPLNLSGEFISLPDGWSATIGSGRADVGKTVFLPIEVTLPDSAPGQAVATSIRLLDDDAAIGVAPMTIHAGTPDLVLSVADILDFGAGKAYKITLQNSGSAPASAVSVVLRSGGLDHDRESLAHLLPGRTVQVTLVAGSALTDAEVIATAAHDPEGVLLQAGLDPAGDDQAAAGAAIMPVLALILSMVVAGRRWRRGAP